MKKEYFWNCWNNPFDTEEEFTDTCEKWEEVSLKQFVVACDVEKNTMRDMIVFWKPSYTYWKYKYKDNEEYTYYYIRSAIEFFYRY